MLKHRLITGFSAGGIIISVLFLCPAWTHLVFLLALFALALMEFRDMAHASGHRFEFLGVLVCGLLFLLATAAESPVFHSYLQAKYPSLAISPPGRMDVSGFLMAITPAVLLIVAILRRKTERAMETAALSFAGFWYVAVLLSFLIRLAFEWPIREDGHTNYTGRLILLLFLMLVKFGDIGGFFIGSKFGKRKLIPEISPKKSIEGLYGEYASSLCIGLIWWAILRFGYDGSIGSVPFTLGHAIALPLLLTTTGILGDLAESLIKRSVGFKDSSSRFPGMGGCLDMLDSVLFSAPFMYAYAVWFF